MVQRAAVARHLRAVGQPRPRFGVATQAEAGLTFEHHFTDWFWGRIGYRHGNAADGGPFQENRLLTEQILNMPYVVRQVDTVGNRTITNAIGLLFTTAF
ncbi:MAG: hypothetical protein ACOY4R_10195 [Pseudomonadota bacterium]